MKFNEYIEGKASLTEFEAGVFGLGGLAKGWRKRGMSVEITEEMLSVIVSYYENTEMSRTGKKAFTRATKALRRMNHPPSNLKKYLYVMKNSYGDLKIGISIDPIKRARHLTTSSGSTVECQVYWVTESPAFEVETFLLRHYKAFRKEGEWFEPHAFAVQDVESMIPCAKTKVYDVKEFKPDAKKQLTDTEEYEYLHIKHETPKATLFNILGSDVWIPKSCIKSLNPNRHIVKVRIGMISDKLKSFRVKND